MDVEERMISPVIEERPNQGNVLIPIWLACAIAFSATAIIVLQLCNFYRVTASLVPGTPIRPMGLALLLGLVEMASMIVGGLCAIFGGFHALKQERWRAAIFAGLALVLTWMPMVVCNRGLDWIVSMRKLVLEE